MYHSKYQWYREIHSILGHHKASIERTSYHNLKRLKGVGGNISSPLSSHVRATENGHKVNASSLCIT